MKTIAKQPIAIICIFTWIGFVCAISFMEAWIKFRAPGINVALGLGIGRLVFAALNKVEWVFAIAVLINIIVAKQSFLSFGNISYIVVLTVLLLQTFWLLPALDARAELHIQGLKVISSNLHFYFIAMEVLKVCSLFITGILFFKPDK